MLQQRHIDIIKSLVPLLTETGPALTEHFYQRLFHHHPELKNIFNMSNQASGRQKAALFEAIAAYAQYIDNVGALKSAVERIAHKHTSFNIQPEMYQIVGHHLTETLRELTGELFTADVEEAWTAAYDFLASVFIHREGELYDSRAQSQGGWRDSRPFVVSEKIKESELVTSFVLTPEDGKDVVGFLPGQYLGISVQPKDHPFTEIRQYSLSTKPNGKNYRISVKREVCEPNGIVSNYLHDHMELGDTLLVNAPAGDFFFEDKQSPVVLISAGVGVTPMQSMLEYLAALNYEHDVYYLHACQSTEQHSFKARTAELTALNNWQTYTWYEDANDDNNQSTTTFNGLVDLNNARLPYGQAHFYVCGPVAFMRFIKKQLLDMGVGAERIHYEVFGPHAEL
ncbi:NO-inducible flavohemoprotein [Pseudoalteromonas spongiae]|uniref:NO-inducible flavohemoprotein n=1 Tax=Pseudoalteromonas spongiae TaxID=298657 RepID=UPI00110BD26C|nr:NO-inducible flavohemoprotein [Pseudoalteromonas spongiae]TMO84190.1 NO-inducible flavohemoprotein [Pseudoalteromonas spongiae]